MRLRTTMHAALAASLLLFSCTKRDIVSDAGLTGQSELAAVANQSTFYGPTVSMGQGTVRSFTVLDGTQKPVQMGFELTATALEGLFEHHNHGDHHGHEAFLVPLHQQAKAHTIFDHLVVDWNAHGHEPGPYLAPHFDFHFYMMKLADRLQIAANDPNSTVAVAAGYLPNDYIGPLGPEPEMGAHCVDATSPELNGNPFTHTFIYGAYNGKITFYEPMVTHDYLMTASAGTLNIKQPEKFNKAGYYPTTYNIYNTANGNRYVVLSDFVYRKKD